MQLCTAELERIERLAPSPRIESAERWYAVQCRPHHERIAALHLVNQDFRIFLPLRIKARRHARRIDTVRVPFFPGYLFVRLDLARDRWRSVNGTFGVTRLVMQGDRPAAAPRGIVETLIDTCGEDGVLRWQPALEPGQQVRVLTGPFAELIGELDRMSDGGRVRVLLNIMGTGTAVLLPRDNLVRANSCL